MRARRRVNRQREAIGHAVRHTQEFHFAVSDANALARLHRHETIARIDAVLLELRPQKRQRQRAAVDRSVDQRPDVRNAADVIFVAVGQQQRGRSRLALLQIRQVGNQQIDARELRSGKHHARHR